MFFLDAEPVGDPNEQSLFRGGGRGVSALPPWPGGLSETVPAAAYGEVPHFVRRDGVFAFFFVDFFVGWAPPLRFVRDFFAMLLLHPWVREGDMLARAGG
jgi:hypothetical protein